MTPGTESMLTGFRKGTPCQLWPGRYGGLLTSLLATFIVSFFGVIIQTLKSIHPVQIVLYRAVSMLVLLAPILIHKKHDLLGPKGRRLQLILRGLFGCNGMVLIVMAFQKLPLGDVAVITSCNPIIVAIMARIFLKEPCHLVKIAALALTVVGFCLLAKVPELIATGTTERFQDANYWWGFAEALTATTFAASNIILLRKLRDIDESVLSFYFAWITTLEMAILTACMGVFVLPGCGRESWFLLLLGVISLFAQLLMAYALRLEQAGSVAIIRASARVLFSFVWQITFFQQIPDAYSISAAVLVMMALGLITGHKWYEGRKKSARKKRQSVVDATL